MDHNTIENGHANNRDSDGEETVQQEPLPMGEETISSREEGIIQAQPPPEQRSNETTTDGKDVCGCTSVQVGTSKSNGSEQESFPPCGKVIPIEQSSGASTSSDLQFQDSRAPLGLLLGQESVNGLTFLPDTPERSLQGNVTTGEGGAIVIAPVAEQEKTAVHGYSDSSVRIPPKETLFTFCVLQQEQSSTNGKWFSLHFFDPEGPGNVSTWIKAMEERFGYKIQVVSIGEEYLSQEENRPFHTAFIENHITIKFELVKQVHRKFRIRNADIADKVPLSRIQSLNQNRVFPGAIAKVFVESLAEPDDKICQDHLRMTLQYGATQRRMLIPVWSFGQL